MISCNTPSRDVMQLFTRNCNWSWTNPLKTNKLLQFITVAYAKCSPQVCTNRAVLNFPFTWISAGVSSSVTILTFLKYINSRINCIYRSWMKRHIQSSHGDADRGVCCLGSTVVTEAAASSESGTHLSECTELHSSSARCGCSSSGNGYRDGGGGGGGGGSDWY